MPQNSKCMFVWVLFHGHGIKDLRVGLITSISVTECTWHAPENVTATIVTS